MKNEAEQYEEALHLICGEAAQFANKEFENPVDEIYFRKAQIAKIRVFANNALRRFTPKETKAESDA